MWMRSTIRDLDWPELPQYGVPQSAIMMLRCRARVRFQPARRVLLGLTLPIANPMEDFSGKMFVCSRAKLGVAHHAGEYFIVALHSRDEQFVQNTIQIS